jgi:hypothetical protein
MPRSGGKHPETGRSDRPREASDARKSSPKRSQGTPSLQATLRRPNRVLLRLLAWTWKGWVWGVDHLVFAPAAWVRRNPGRVARGLWSGVFRIATLMSVFYLVYDRIYETGATISSPATDPRNPFRLPFTITNNSHLFAIQNVVWECIANHIKGDNIVVADARIVDGSSIEIEPGKNLNIDCNPFGPTSRLIQMDANITEASITISLHYDSKIFGVYSLHRSPSESFTWFLEASNSQWVKGKFYR